MSASQKAQPGHLSNGGKIITQISEQGRKKLSAAQKARYVKVKPVELGWKREGE